MTILVKDLRYALRGLFKSPGFTVVAVIAIALGIGANTVIFSVINAVLLRSLPFPAPDRLIDVWESDSKRNLSHIPLSFTKFTDLVDQSRVFDSLGAYTWSTFDLSGRQEPEQVYGLEVSQGFFPTFGIRPLLGRWFLPEEDQSGGSEVAVISYRLWERRFGSDPKIVGKNFGLDGRSTTVVGVMPPSFHFPDESNDVWVPRVFEHKILTQLQIRHGASYLGLIARLKPGASLAQASAEINTINARYRLQNPGNVDALADLDPFPLLEDTVSNIRPTLLALMSAVGFVLLIACANVANLLLARGASRQKEVSLRLALGASRTRLIRQFLTESVLLASAGGVLGLLIAVVGLKLLSLANLENIPRASQIAIDGWTLAFTLGLTLLTGIAFGIVPALRASGTSLIDSLKEGGRESSESLRRNRFRSVLVVGEIAVALVLLAGAGLLLRSFIRLVGVNPGFNAHRLLTLHIALPTAQYPQPEQQQRFFEDLVRRARSLPGVQSAAVSSYLPLGGGDIFYFFHPEDQPDLGPGKNPTALLGAIHPDYFRTLGIPLLRGRAFAETDTDTAAPVMIVDQSMAKHYWPNQDPVGQRVIYSRENITAEVVGVVGSVKYSGLNSGSASEMYVPYTQRPWPSMTLEVRAASDPSMLAGAVREQIQALDKNQPVSSLRTMDEVVAGSVAQARLTMFLLGIFAAAALALAALGIYGVMSYSVARRTHEIGIRMALGAETTDVLRLVVGQGMTLALIGLAVGLGGAFALTRFLASLLFDVRPTDAATLAAVSVGLLAVALAANYIPARRATKIDPLAALRHE
ncbi:MAG TPA: ABC transporter permease [Terriglobia bacterium]|nr:ABC transporter permease [Terriglobia bacterium]